MIQLPGYQVQGDVMPTVHGITVTNVHYAHGIHGMVHSI